MADLGREEFLLGVSGMLGLHLDCFSQADIDSEFSSFHRSGQADLEGEFSGMSGFHSNKFPTLPPREVICKICRLKVLDDRVRCDLFWKKADATGGMNPIRWCYVWPQVVQYKLSLLKLYHWKLLGSNIMMSETGKNEELQTTHCNLPEKKGLALVRL